MHQRNLNPIYDHKLPLLVYSQGQAVARVERVFFFFFPFWFFLLLMYSFPMLYCIVAPLLCKCRTLSPVSSEWYILKHQTVVAC